MGKLHNKELHGLYLAVNIIGSCYIEWPVGRLIGSCYIEWAVGRLIGNCYSEWAVGRLIAATLSGLWAG